VSDYAYVANSALVGSVTSPGHRAVNAFETGRNLLAAKVNETLDEPTATVISSYVYGLDAVGRRTAVSLSGSAFGNAPSGYGYLHDDYGELLAANHSADSARNRAYAYDPIGNRLWQTAGNEPLTQPPAEMPSTGVPTTYETNSLNQYVAVASGGGVAEPIYDDDGNMLSFGEWAYSWDGENRLAAAERHTGANPVSRIEFVYDHASRRVAKRTYSWDTDDWSLESELRFVYDGWNPIARYAVALQTGTLLLDQGYAWGLDLSGSIQGAGGVGGLLGVLEAGPEPAFYAAAFDGNGNVSDLIDAATGGVAAHYEYNPFGGVLVASGPLADSNPFRFSTKYEDAETSLLYYGFRYCSPGLGRWLSRDPIGEQDGVHLYRFVDNSPIHACDWLGLNANPACDFDGNGVVEPPECQMCPGCGGHIGPVNPVPPPAPGPPPTPPPPVPPGTCTIELWCWPAFGWPPAGVHCEYNVLGSSGGNGRCRGGLRSCPSLWRDCLCGGMCAGTTWLPFPPPMPTGAFLASTVTVPAATCHCLRNTCASYPRTRCYRAYPVGPWVANSNTVASCLNARCSIGVTGPGPGLALGWGHAGGCP